MKRNKDLIKRASGALETAYNALDDPRYALFLSDESGTILHVMDGALEEGSGNASPRPGQSRAEIFFGTNSVCLALSHRKDALALGAEHFLIRLHETAGATSLIRNKTNEIVGTVTLAFPSSMFDLRLPAVVKLCASMIEKDMELHGFSKILDDALEHVEEAALVTDSNLKILTSNGKFKEFAGTKKTDLLSLDVKKMFPEIDFASLLGGPDASAAGEVDMFVGNSRRRVSFHFLGAESRAACDRAAIIFREARSSIAAPGKTNGRERYYNFSDIITRDPAMESLIGDAKRMAELDVPVLITGESGTGKELFAQSIHSASRRKDNPFIAVNCAALPGNLIESELFGYDKGAFTGAGHEGKPGKFELADGGTIFLDEIGELPLDLQAKILRILDDYKVARIGGLRAKPLDIRVVAATNRDLYGEVRKNNFRLDLFYRLNVLSLHIPPLRERRDDVELFLAYFVNLLNAENPRLEKKRAPGEILEILRSYDWPGNVRELRNVVAKSYFLSPGPEISRRHLAFPEKAPPEAGLSAEPADLPAERRIIEGALEKSAGRVFPAARLLGMPLSTLYRKISKYKIDRRKFARKNYKGFETG
ncbi:MAG: sigma 54-interacting transcriptional regulator [Deltaproteobacteria bacterium]|nr:sigma 54-interacting transcriptional regulator [Deltaproteobacteria bacterium]